MFLQNANVNLLSSVLDTPAFFWSAPDHLQALYERACEYLGERVRARVDPSACKCGYKGSYTASVNRGVGWALVHPWQLAWLSCRCAAAQNRSICAEPGIGFGSLAAGLGGQGKGWATKGRLTNPIPG